MFCDKMKADFLWCVCVISAFSSDIGSFELFEGKETETRRQALCIHVGGGFTCVR